MSDVIFQPKSGEVALGTSTGAAIDVNGAEYVRLINTAALGTHYLITLEQTDGSEIGTFSIDGGTSVVIRKASNHKIWSANAAVLACRVRVNSTAGLVG